MAVKNDQSRPALGPAEDLKRILDVLEIVRIADAEHVPAICQEAHRDFLGEGDARVALDGDVIVVVDPAEVVERKMAGERGCLRSNAFHQATIAADRVDVIIEDIKARAVIATRKPFPSDPHADTGGDALTQWTGRRLDPGDQVIFRMPRRLAAQLAEAANVVEGDRRLAGAFVLRV